MGPGVARSVSLLLLLLATGCAPGSGPDFSGRSTPGPEASLAADLPASPGPAPLACGAAFEPGPAGPLSVTGHFPATVPAGAEVVTGTVHVAARAHAVEGVVTPRADAFLVRGGRVVTLPVAQDDVGRRLDLSAGRVEQLPAAATLHACAGAGALGAGTYELYVRVVLNHDDGSRTETVGGPWALEVG